MTLKRTLLLLLVMLVVNAAGHKVEAQAVWGLPPMLRAKERNAES